MLEKPLGVLESHWIPMDSELWKLDNYPEFLAERRRLLAAAANRFLDSLASGTISDGSADSGALRWTPPLGGIVSSDEEQVLIDTSIWMTEQGLPEGELAYELVDERSGELMVTLDLAWPDGIQEGFSSPVALLIDEGLEVERLVNQAGYRSFTSPQELKSYVRVEILGDQHSSTLKSKLRIKTEPCWPFGATIGASVGSLPTLSWP